MRFNPVAAAGAVAPHHSRFGFLMKWNLAILALLKPLGAWGVGAIAVIDSAAIPMPLDAMVVDYVVHDHARAVVYCLMAALGSAVGSLLPYFLGRAGGELFLLKRINRERYEKLRDRFEKQEFLAIMLPAMAPPPFPVKLFEFAAGVFEMRLVWYFSAIFLGKFIRFVVVSFLIIFFGQKILTTAMGALHHHFGLVLAGCGVLLLLLAIYVIRKLFDGKRGVKFPAEEEDKT
ncbi:YqaA family protein [Granulicella arctica]|uniref:YqaA family protein n=1 Tax=Granulicella arctica TaxID=940613 RepID=UPI0021DFF345|nr:VTT domain-containing protein [Granulicella arctica]